MGGKEKRKGPFGPMLAALVGIALLAGFVVIYPRLPIVEDAPIVKGILQPANKDNAEDTMFYVQYGIAGLGALLFLGGTFMAMSRGKKKKK